MIRACHHCGLIQTVAEVPAGMRACCPRCHGALRGAQGRGGRSRTAAVATAALLLYPLAVTLPVMRIERFGHVQEASILEGIATLLGRGHLVVGVVVLICSVVLPLAKLAALLVLSAGGLGLARRHQVLTYRLVDLTGRWGMLDVLLVALLVAVLKLGDMVEVTVGPGATAFAACVVLSLIAAASFRPHSLWEPQP
jgi:paraquat-inducible protein A